MAIIYDLIRKVESGEMLTIKERWLFRNEYSSEFDNQAKDNFRNKEWCNSTLDNLVRLFNYISKYEAPVFNKDVARILWAHDIKKYTMTIKIFSYFNERPKTLIGMLKNINNVIHATITLSNEDMRDAAIGINSNRIDTYNKTGIMIRDEYNKILYQTKYSLNKIGITKDEATKIIDIKGIEELKSILGINRYDCLSVQFFYL